MEEVFFFHVLLYFDHTHQIGCRNTNHIHAEPFQRAVVGYLINYFRRNLLKSSSFFQSHGILGLLNCTEASWVTC